MENSREIRPVNPNVGSEVRSDSVQEARPETANVRGPTNTVRRRFVKAKETPGTVMFTEQPNEGEPEISGRIYLKKWIAGNATSIRITVEKE